MGGMSAGSIKEGCAYQRRDRRGARGMLPRRWSRAPEPKANDSILGTAVFDRFGQRFRRFPWFAAHHTRRIVQQAETGTQNGPDR